MENYQKVVRKLKERKRKKERKEKKLKDAGVARTFCIIAHLLHQICQILPRVFANGKKKGKER